MSDFVLNIDERSLPADVVAKRIPAAENLTIPPGSQLTLGPNQEAAILKNGQVAGVFGPGQHTLAEPGVRVVIVSKKIFGDIPWGTASGVNINDPELGNIQVRAHGKVSLSVSDTSAFCVKMAASRPAVSLADLQQLVRERLTSSFTGFASKFPGLRQVQHSRNEIALGMKAELSHSLATLGLSIDDVIIGAINVPAEIEEMIRKRDAEQARRQAEAEAMRAREAAAWGPAGAPANVYRMDPLPENLVAIRVPPSGETQVNWDEGLVIPSDHVGVFMKGRAFGMAFGPGCHRIAKAQAGALGGDPNGQGPPPGHLLLMRAGFPTRRWTTPEFQLADPKCGMIPVQAAGQVSIDIADASAFCTRVVEDRPTLGREEFEAFLAKQQLVTTLVDEISKRPGGFMDATKVVGEIAAAAKARLTEAWRPYGLELREFTLAGLRTSQEVQGKLNAVAADEAKKEKVREFPCPQCGSKIIFAPSEGLKCPSCGYTQKVAESAEQVEEFSFEAYLRSPRARGAMTPEGKDVACKNCGAATHVAGDVVSTRCAFCGDPLVLESVQLPPCIQPEGIIAFVLKPDQAVESFRNWTKNLWFAPNALKKAATPDRIVGIYRPYWTFDSHTNSWYSGERGTYYYVTESYTDSQGRRQTRQVRKIRWTPVSGRVQEFFDDVLVSAGKVMEWNTTYDLTKAVPYNSGFVAGWQAERYSIPPENAWPEAKRIIDAGIDTLVRRDIGGDEQRVHSIKTQYNAITFKHLLLPLYLSSYFFNRKTYRFQVNGQTGEVKGQRPWSFWKIFFLVLAILAAIGGAVWLFGRTNKSASRTETEVREQSLTPKERSKRLVQEAEDWHRRGYPVEATQSCARAIEADRFNPDAHHLMARCQEELGNRREAIESYESALRVAPAGWPHRESAEKRLEALK